MRLGCSGAALVGGESFYGSWRKHEWFGSWSVTNQKGGFTGANVLVGEWCGISSISSTPIISVQWGRRAPRHPIPPVLGWTGHGGPGRDRVWRRREECACAPPAATSHVPVAPQARPTIAAEERPREAMPAVTEEAERVWDRTHIND